MKQYLFIIIAVLLVGCVEQKPQIPANATSTKGESKKMTLLEYNKLCKEQEDIEIQQFINSDSLKFITSDDGYWYSILKNGSGKNIQKSQTVNIAYSIELLDGKTCKAFNINDITNFRVGARQVPKGLDIAICKFKVGTQLKLILPSHLAYGIQGDGKCITPRTPILYKITILNCE